MFSNATRHFIYKIMCTDQLSQLVLKCKCMNKHLRANFPFSSNPGAYVECVNWFEKCQATIRYIRSIMTRIMYEIVILQKFLSVHQLTVYVFVLVINSYSWYDIRYSFSLFHQLKCYTLGFSNLCLKNGDQHVLAVASWVLFQSA